MKFNIFKYIFIMVSIGLIVYAVYVINDKGKNDEANIATQQVEQEETSQDLKIGISNFDTINPIMTSNKEIQKLNKLIFEPLVEVDENYKIKMCLASEISKTGDNIYLIKLNTNIKWHDGSTICAKDVQFTIDRLKEVQSAYSYNVKDIIQVEVVDYSMVKIYLSKDVPFFEYNLTFPILSNFYYINENYFTSTKLPLGTGQYKIKEIQSSYIQLEKNNEWHNIKEQDAKIQNIRVNIFSEMGEVYNSFKIGNIDLINTSNLNVESYIGTIGYNKKEYKGREFDYLSFNCANEVLSNKEVRKAIGFTIDKSNIVSEVFNNNYYTSNFPLDYGNYVYDQDSVSSGFNVEQSKKILADAGWELKNNTWQKNVNGKILKTSFNLIVNSNSEYKIRVCEKIKQQLGEVGIKVNIVKVSQDSYNNYLLNKNYELILTGIYNSYSPSVENFFANGNISNYTNDEIYKIMGEVKNMKDEGEIKNKYKRLIEIYNDDLPFVSLYRNKSIIITNSNLKGDIVANNYSYFSNIENWKR